MLYHISFMLVYVILSSKCSEDIRVFPAHQPIAYFFPMDGSATSQLALVNPLPIALVLCISMLQAQRQRAIQCVSAPSASEPFVFLTVEGLQPTIPMEVDVLAITDGTGSLDQVSTAPLQLYHLQPLTSRPDLLSVAAIQTPYYGLLSLVSAGFALQLQVWGAEACGWLELEVIGFQTFFLPCNASEITATQLDIAANTWMFLLTPRRDSVGGPTLAGYPAPGYIEYVLSDEDIHSAQLFVSPRETEVEDPADVGNIEVNEVDMVTSVCIWSSNEMDGGQKRIWLAQAAHLSPAHYNFTFILNLLVNVTLMMEDANSRQDTLLHQLRQLQRTQRNVHVAEGPFNRFTIARQDAGKMSLDEIYGLWQRLFTMVEGDINHIEPAWCREPFALIRALLLQHQCDVVVYGASTVLNSDARSLGMRSVMELQNLFPDVSIPPDLIVGPSQYALQHESVVHLLQGSAITMGLVIQPAVDSQHFQPPLLGSQASWSPLHSRLPECQVTFQGMDEGTMHSLQNSQLPCITIGFVGRLSVAKNPGLFLQTAYHILKRFPFARFVMVGTGKLEASLKELAKRLDIEDKVMFAGFVTYEELPSYLAGIDIMINPSIRGWSETFCIANIEVMAMAIPLITFAVGGKSRVCVCVCMCVCVCVC
ncbi:glycosyltransferase, partial [archaeon]